MKVRHWPNGIQHDHVGINTYDALRIAMECAGHRHSRKSLVTMVDVLERRDRFEFIVPGKRVEVFRLIH